MVYIIYKIVEKINKKSLEKVNLILDTIKEYQNTNKRVRFFTDDKIIREGILIEDKMFLGGYKIESENMVLSINLVTIIED